VRCKDCRDTGFTLEGFDVTTSRQPDPAADSDELAQWILSLTSCSHPNASPDGLAEDDTHRTDVVGVHVRPESQGGPGGDGPALAPDGAA
jgi:hypothetical protein